MKRGKGPQHTAKTGTPRKRRHVSKRQQPVRVWPGMPVWMAAFTASWISRLWAVMSKTGKGYRRPKQERETPRADKRVIPADPTRFQPHTRRSQRQPGEVW
jgi:hypothetical protein